MKRFGLLGERLSHSFSPRIHALLGDYEYKLHEKAPGELDGFLRRGDFDGLNVTIPYKKAVLPYCAELSEAARKIGSVNTIIRRPDGTLFGDNTDYAGFSWLLELLGVDAEGKKTLVLGSGGASLTVRPFDGPRRRRNRHRLAQRREQL
jgi:shikimate dehydrogenase